MANSETGYTAVQGDSIIGDLVMVSIFVYFLFDIKMAIHTY